MQSKGSAKNGRKKDSDLILEKTLTLVELISFSIQELFPEEKIKHLSRPKYDNQHVVNQCLTTIETQGVTEGVSLLDSIKGEKNVTISSPPATTTVN